MEEQNKNRTTANKVFETIKCRFIVFAKTRSAPFNVTFPVCTWICLSLAVAACLGPLWDLVHALQGEPSTDTRITHLRTICDWKSVPPYHFSISQIVIICCMNGFRVPHRHFILCRAITPNQFICRKPAFHINALHNHKLFTLLMFTIHKY